MGPILYKDILKTLVHFSKSSKIQNPKILKNEPMVWAKSLKMGTFFCQNDP